MTASGLTLMPLRCPACAGGLDGRDGSSFLYCRACGAGYELSAHDTLEPVRVSFARYTPESRSFHPFWVFDAGLELAARRADRGLKALFTRPDGLAPLFAERGTLDFYCAASTDDLDAERSWGLHLTREQPSLQPEERQAAVEGLLLSEADARIVAEHLFLTSELSQPDVVRQLEYTLLLTNPRVVVIAL